MHDKTKIQLGAQQGSRIGGERIAEPVVDAKDMNGDSPLGWTSWLSHLLNLLQHGAFDDCHKQSIGKETPQQQYAISSGLITHAVRPVCRRFENHFANN